MAKRNWQLEGLSAQNVKVEHEFVWLGNRIRIWLDDDLIYERKPKFWDMGEEYRFKIDNLPCIIRIMPRVIDFCYELWIDGKLQ